MDTPGQGRDPPPGRDGGDDEESWSALATIAVGMAILAVGVVLIGTSLFADPVGAEPSVQVGTVEASNATANVSEDGAIETLEIDLETNVQYENVGDDQEVRVELLLAIPEHNDGEPIQLNDEQVDVDDGGERTIEFTADVLESEEIDSELFSPGDDGEYEEELEVIVRVEVVDESLDDPTVDAAEASDTFTLTVLEAADAVIVSFEAAAEVNAVGDEDSDDEDSDGGEDSDGDEDSDGE